MIIKPRDDKERDITALKELLGQVTEGSHAHSLIAKELAIVRAGNRAEEEMAFLLDHDYGKATDLAVINDLRIRVGNRSAQIDHLLIHNSLTFFVIETKSVREGIRILDNGEFLRWNGYRHAYEGMASPLAQNERHIAVLQDALVPMLHGGTQAFVSVIAVSKGAQIKRTNAFDTGHVVKSDLLAKFVKERLASEIPRIDGRCLSPDALQKLGHTIAGWHSPIVVDYAAKFGMQIKNQSSRSTTRACPEIVAPAHPVGAQTIPAKNDMTAAMLLPQRPAHRLGRRTGIAVLALLAVVVLVGRKNQGIPPQPMGKQAAIETTTKQKIQSNQQARTTRFVPAAIAGNLSEGENCFTQKRYDCAISSANAVLRIEPSNARAATLRRRAEQEQAQAMNAIAIQ